MNDPIPPALQSLFERTDDVDATLAGVVEAYGRAIHADRCLLFLYEPERRLSRCTHAWQVRPEWALRRRMDIWQPLPEGLADTDPMFALALHDPVAVTVDDIDRADPSLVNAPYEREHFGHQALIHAPIFEDGVLHGILEPCTIAAPREWTGRDRTITAWTQTQLLPLAKRYVAENCP